MENNVHHGFRGQTINTLEVDGLRLVDGLFPARTRIGSHSHPYAVFCIGLTGMCSEVFAGEVRCYKASTVQFLPAGQSHSLDFPVADTRAFSMNIDASLTERAREFSLKLDDSIHVHGGLLASLMMKAYSEFTHQDTASSIAIQGLAMEMLAAASRHNSRISDRRPQRWLLTAEEYLRENFTENLSLANVALAAGVHPVYMAREFRRFHGCTVGEYLRRLRIDQACRQLGSSNRSLAAIAAGAGFYDQSHFSRTFKRLMGMSPASYRSKFGTGNEG